MSKLISPPYFKIKSNKIYYSNTKFFRRKFLPTLRKNLPYHYLITQDRRKFIEFIKKISKKYPYFLTFDIIKYFPNINHNILLTEIRFNYKKLTNKNPSRRFKQLLKKDLPQFLNKSPYQNKAIPLGNSFSHILAGIYLLRLDLALTTPFLRFCDDYIIFCKSKKESKILLTQTIISNLNKLELSINLNKLNSGKFYQDKVSFLGFQFYAGYIIIKPDKINNFKKKIKDLTYLTKHKPYQMVIKELNKLISGFGNYYKLANCRQEFLKLDSFIRARLRRYLQRNKNTNLKIANLILTNKTLKSLRLKSLTDIYDKYTLKNKLKIKKTTKSKPKTTKSQNITKSSQLVDIKGSYQIKIINKKLDNLTTLVKRVLKEYRASQNS